MEKFLNILANGMRSLSFAPTMEIPKFERKDYKRRIALREPKNPQEIMREAWEDVGNRMWEAVGVVEK